MSSSFDKIFLRWMDAPVLKEFARSPQPLSLNHLPASAQAFLLAAMARNFPKKIFLAVAPGIKAQEGVGQRSGSLERSRTLLLPQVEVATAETLPDPEVLAERLSALNRLASGFTGVVLATEHGSEQPLPEPDDLRGNRVQLLKNTRRDRDDLLAQLQKAGYTREAQVQGRGQFSVRGAVLDIFSWDSARPLRTEWEDEELISLREFDIDAQRSVQTLKTAEVSLAQSRFQLDPEGGDDPRQLFAGRFCPGEPER